MFLLSLCNDAIGLKELDKKKIIPNFHHKIIITSNVNSQNLINCCASAKILILVDSRKNKFRKSNLLNKETNYTVSTSTLIFEKTHFVGTLKFSLT